ncbi:unnamed protein product [Schistosoma turkestanicum]|nr:unnamed protein product [Schistosoma turkestanicum]
MPLTDCVSHFGVSEELNTTNMENHSISCPCGNPQSCPLSKQKIECLSKNPCILHGFTILAAVFRGRLIRQLLATKKVNDLICTVKDTAKLALSLRIERQCTIVPTQQNTTCQFEQLSDEELFLESRLIKQLHHTLNEIHEIFFLWPIVKQISLVTNSKSVISLKCKKSITNIGYDHQTTATTTTVNCSATKFNGQTSINNSNNHNSNTLRILRQLQLDQVNSSSKYNKQNNDNVVNGEVKSKCFKKWNVPIVPNKPIKQITDHRANHNNINKSIHKQSFTQNKKSKSELNNNSKFQTTYTVNKVNQSLDHQDNNEESCEQQPQQQQLSINTNRKNNQHFMKSLFNQLTNNSMSRTRTLSSSSSKSISTSRNNARNTGADHGSSCTNNTFINPISFIDRTKSIKPRIIRHFSSNKIEYNNNNNNHNTPLNSNHKNDSLNMINCELDTNFNDDQQTSVENANVHVEVNNSLNLKTTHSEKCLENVVETKILTTTLSEQINSSTLTQCETTTPTTTNNSSNNNNISLEKYFPVKRRILSKKSSK